MALAARPFHANHAPFLDTGSDDPLARALPSSLLQTNLPTSASQAESGKSTTLKSELSLSVVVDVDTDKVPDFQLAFSPQHFRSEKLAWRTIIQLNLIRSIKQLLE
ncbi:hypothetical protein EIP91_005003, partial [Steccherinum ochraceum]